MWRAYRKRYAQLALRLSAFGEFVAHYHVQVVCTVVAVKEPFVFRLQPEGFALGAAESV